MQAASDQESTRPGGPPPKAPVPPRPRGRGLALFALLLALVAALLAGVLYWRTYYEPSPLTFRITQIEARLAELDRRVKESATEIDRALRDVQPREQERRAPEPTGADGAPASAAAAIAPPTAAAAIAPPTAATPADWQLAEVRYLLRMANHRLQLERDVRGAALLLRAADDSLARLDDPRFTPVRAHIAQELLALDALPGADAEGLFLALEAIKSDLGDLKARTPSFTPSSPEPQPADGTLARLATALADLVRFRRLDTPADVLLLPEEALYLELNLRLMLERAQLAALRREQSIYDSSIAEARAWVLRYLDPTDPGVQRVSEGLAAVAPMELAAALPDVSASLVTLDTVLGAAP